MNIRSSKARFRAGLTIAALLSSLAVMAQASVSEPVAATQSTAVDDSDARPPVTQADLRIVIRARELLDSPSKWNRADNRKCRAGAKTFSLYCALEVATTEVGRHFEHRGAALQEMRFVIDDQTFSTIYRGTFSNGEVSGIELVPGVSRQQPGIVNSDVEVSPDGDTLYFVDAKFGPGGPETADIVIAERSGTGFGRVRNSEKIMQHINTSALEYAPCISADGLTLLFTRARLGIGGSVAIYLSHRRSRSEPFGSPARLTALAGFVEAPTLSPDERSIYFHKKEGTKFVIYRASR